MIAVNLYQWIGVPTALIFVAVMILWVISASKAPGWHVGLLVTWLVALAVWVPLMILDINRAPDEPVCGGRANEILLHKNEALVYIDRIVLVPTETCYVFVAKGT